MGSPEDDARRQVQAEVVAGLRGELLDTVDAAVVAVELEGRIVEWNRGAQRLYGWHREEAIGRTTDELGLGPAGADDRERLIAAFIDRRGWSGRLSVRHRDGGTVDVFVRAAGTHDPQGAHSGMVTIAVDISDQVRFEDEVSRSREHLEAVMDQMAEGLCTIDEQDRITYANGATERLLGMPSEVLLGCRLADLVHGSAATPGGYAESLLAGPCETPVEAEEELVRADGTLLPVALSAAPFDAGEGAAGATILFRDISREKAERDRTRRELEAMSWIGPIRDALAESRMELFAQPIVRLPGGKRLQQELLLRMHGPGGAVIAAGRFLPAAERFLMVREIDRWVIPEAIAIAARTGEPVQFNLSAASIQDPETPELIEDALTRCAVDPGAVVIEVTESGLIEERAVAERFAKRIVEDGCSLALDDFGTGYGGFTYLTHLPVSMLKIDRSFVTSLPTNTAGQKVVAAVVGLGREFGQTVIAEGVEDEETLELLADFGVDAAQGYFVGRPASLGDFRPESVV